MARKMVCYIWIELDPDLDEDTTERDVQESLDLALRRDPKRVFPYLVIDTDVQEEDDT